MTPNGTPKGPAGRVYTADAKANPLSVNTKQEGGGDVEDVVLGSCTMKRSLK
jgi:hypothetical protein